MSAPVLYLASKSPRRQALLRQLDAGLLDIDELDQLTRIAIKDLAFKLADSWCR